MQLQIKRVHAEAKLPSREPGNNGFDLYAVTDDYFVRKSDGNFLVLKPYERYLFDTGLQIALPEKHFAMIRPRSGLANKYGIQVLGGLIDESYRGNWKIILYNSGRTPYTIMTGDKIAQFVIIKDSDYELIETIELEETKRGASGFGSSGR